MQAPGAAHRDCCRVGPPQGPPRLAAGPLLPPSPGTPALPRPAAQPAPHLPPAGAAWGLTRWSGCGALQMRWALCPRSPTSTSPCPSLWRPGRSTPPTAPRASPRAAPWRTPAPLMCSGKGTGCTCGLGCCTPCCCASPASAGVAVPLGQAVQRRAGPLQLALPHSPPTRLHPQGHWRARHLLGPRSLQ